jgi:hypothetical protein
VALTPSSRRALDEAHNARLNFDASEFPETGSTGGWHVDDYCQPLPAEAPGPPVPGGPWAVTCRLMRDYEFADPKIVRAVYHTDAPLEDRTMLLEARFYWLRFHFGVRVGGVTDTVKTVEGRPVRVWGWNYRTLQGHLEMGQMDYQAWKWLDTGTVEFRIHVVSRAARIPNPLIRLGFALFGRRMQKKFARRALARMHSLVLDAVGGGQDRCTGNPPERRLGSVSSDGPPRTPASTTHSTGASERVRLLVRRQRSRPQITGPPGPRLASLRAWRRRRRAEDAARWMMLRP